MINTVKNIIKAKNIGNSSTKLLLAQLNSVADIIDSRFYIYKSI